jgi:hypothetical protein
MIRKAREVSAKKTIYICQLGSKEQCPLLRKLNGSGLDVCAHDTYVDLRLSRPNCQK